MITTLRNISLVENGCLNYAFDEDDNGTNSRTQSASSRQGIIINTR